MIVNSHVCNQFSTRSLTFITNKTNNVEELKFYSMKKKKGRSPKNEIQPGKNPWSPPTKPGMISILYTTSKKITPIEMGKPIIIYVENFKQALTDACTKTGQKAKITQTLLHRCKKTPYSERNAWALIN
jgi:hypothetical protein